MERTSVTTDASGRRVLAKVANNAEQAARLDREAELLDAGRHPGVVELVGVDGRGVGAALLTAHVDGPTLADAGPLVAEEAAGLLAALAATLADLHDLGLVHGAVAPEHILIGPSGRPLLCSLGYGGRLGDRAQPGPDLADPFVDPTRAGAPGLTPALDVFGIGALATFLAPTPSPGHVLATVAAQATLADPAQRPSARALAESLAQEVPAARLPRDLAPGPPGRPAPAPATDPLEAWRRQGGGSGDHRGGDATRARMVVLVVLVVAAVAGGTFLVSRRPSAATPTPTAAQSRPLPEQPPPPEEARPGPSTTRAGPASSSTIVRRDCPSVTAVLQADVDGDGCPEALRYAAGVLDAGAARWAVGQPGDQVVVGNWGCQGRRTLALLRPSTGEVFHFAGWAAPGQDLTATAIGRVDGAQALRAADLDRDGCHEIVVERGAGAPEVIRLARPAPPGPAGAGTAPPGPAGAGTAP